MFSFHTICHLCQFVIAVKNKHVHNYRTQLCATTKKREKYDISNSESVCQMSNSFIERIKITSRIKCKRKQDYSSSEVD